MIVDGFIDWARRIDGHPLKVYSQPNAGLGIACHSIVGDLPNHSIPSRFLSDDRNPDGSFTASAAASVMFILYRDGHLIQMYPVTASTWTSGGFEGNTRYWAIEAEGGGYPNYGEDLTKAAQDTFVRLVTEWEAHSGLTALPNLNILQHRQIAARYGYAATACASGRYDTAWSRIAAGERYGDMTPAETQALIDQRLDATLGVTLLTLLEQMLGIKESTFDVTNQKRVDAILARLEHTGIEDHQHIPGGVA